MTVFTQHSTVLLKATVGQSQQQMIGYPSIAPINFTWFMFVMNVGKNIVWSGHIRLTSVTRYKPISRNEGLHNVPHKWPQMQVHFISLRLFCSFYLSRLFAGRPHPLLRSHSKPTCRPRICQKLSPAFCLISFDLENAPTQEHEIEPPKKKEKKPVAEAMKEKVSEVKVVHRSSIIPTQPTQPQGSLWRV